MAEGTLKKAISLETILKWAKPAAILFFLIFIVPALTGVLMIGISPLAEGALGVIGLIGDAGGPIFIEIGEATVTTSQTSSSGGIQVEVHFHLNWLTMRIIEAEFQMSASEVVSKSDKFYLVSELSEEGDTTFLKLGNIVTTYIVALLVEEGNKQKIKIGVYGISNFLALMGKGLRYWGNSLLHSESMLFGL